GIVPGYAPGKDVVPAVLSPGEGVLRPEVVKVFGPELIHAWNEAARRGNIKTSGLPGFANGGVVGEGFSLTNWLKDVFWGGLAKAVRLAKNNLIAPAVNKVFAPLGNYGWAPFMKQIPINFMDKLITWAEKKDAEPPPASQAG